MSLIVLRVKSTSFSPVPAYKDPIFGLLNSRVSIKAHASSFSWVKFPISVAKRSAVCKSVSFSNTSGSALKAYTRPSSSSLSKKSTEQLHNSELNNKIKTYFKSRLAAAKRVFLSELFNRGQTASKIGERRFKAQSFEDYCLNQLHMARSVSI